MIRVVEREKPPRKGYLQDALFAVHNVITALFTHKKVREPGRNRNSQASSALHRKQLQPLIRYLSRLSIRELVFDLLIKLGRLGGIRTAVVIR